MVTDFTVEILDISDLINHGAVIKIDNSKHMITADYTDKRGAHHIQKFTSTLTITGAAAIN